MLKNKSLVRLESACFFYGIKQDNTQGIMAEFIIEDDGRIVTKKKTGLPSINLSFEEI